MGMLVLFLAGVYQITEKYRIEIQGVLKKQNKTNKNNPTLPKNSNQITLLKIKMLINS